MEEKEIVDRLHLELALRVQLIRTSKLNMLTYYIELFFEVCD